MATQIRSCPLSRLTIGSASDFHTNVLAAITATTPTVLHIETLEPNYKQLVEQLASVVNRQRSYVSTKKLNELDDLRDNGSGFIFNVLDANKTCLIAAKVDAANRLLAQISAYRGIRNHEYSKQSAELRGMLAVLEAAENAADVETLSIGPDIEALREVADQFEAAVGVQGQGGRGIGVRRPERSRLEDAGQRRGEGIREYRADCQRLRDRAADRRAVGLHQRGERLCRGLCPDR